ncbi:hypothetical protein LSUE1_G008072 [Lachnellula suecica]|uniref:Uncharacterized protein n=1 Tax=Lachnellula suecica TaxID=602035 RepID=A0A8T9C318_9HELO|nr:hypothetical protein LSUE1_G008072 [Lachnellula suecica]
MLFKAAAAAAIVATGVAAQRPSNTTMCDYYTTALLTNNTAANQMTLLTLVVNTAVIDTTPNVGVKVNGILNPGMVNETAVNLLPYFNGQLASSNRGGVGRSVNFLDGGGAAPLEKNMPANSTTSNQYTLLTHLYEYFGVLLGCSMQGGSDYPAYTGHASMYSVHEFMDLSYAEVTYFIEQVGLSAASFGVTADDVTAVGEALEMYFDVRCGPETTIIPSQGAQLQSICIDSTCPLAANSTCSSYNATMMPSNATASSSVSATSSMSAATGTSTGAVSTGAAAAVGMSFAAIAAGAAALFL